jgi:valyl-tRNA synthetase
MMMMGLKFMGEVPFREVYITGLIRDENGDKMSKSKGNVIDPLDIIDGIGLDPLVAKRTSGLMQPQKAAEIEKNTRRQFPAGIAPHGTDALRFTFAALASASRDIRFDLARVAGYRNFCNKLWNAARFVTMITPEEMGGPQAAVDLCVADRWIRSRFGRTLTQVDSALREYRFDFAATALYEFTWYEFCDWYVELTKPVLQSASAPEGTKRGARRTLVEILEALQRALHPFMPFITEEIWQRVRSGAGETTIMLQPYPTPAEFPEDEQSEREVAWIQKFILAVRQIRGEMDISPAKKLPVLLKDTTPADVMMIERHRPYLERLAGLESLTLLEPDTIAPQSATALVDHLSLLVPMAGLIDPAAEIERLGKQLAKTRVVLAKANQKLLNESFVQNAPPAVVTQERKRVEEFEHAIAGLEMQLARVRSLLQGR